MFLIAGLEYGMDGGIERWNRTLE